MDINLNTEADELELVVSQLDTLYELGETCATPIDVDFVGLKAGDEVSDPIYDEIRKRLQKLRPESSVFKEPTASKAYSGQDRIEHHPPMTSLEKASGTNKNQELKNWLESVQKRLGYSDLRGKIVKSYKRDGVACALYYKEGKLIAAGLRPRDGIHGEDILANVKYVSGIPTQLPIPLTCSIRGELECPISIFQDIKQRWQEPEFGLDREPANPRNYTAGSIRQFKEPAITGRRCLRFVGYQFEDIHTPGTQIDLPRTKRDQAIWANRVLGVNFVRVEFYDDLHDLETMEEGVKRLDYEVDGAVLEVNDRDGYEQMGRHGDRDTGNPRGAIAYKFKDEVATTPFEGCIWSPGRTGTLTPVAQFGKPLSLAGTNVSQCSMHNIAFCVRNKIVPGTFLEVIKSGKIIPKIIAVILPDGTRVSTDATAQVKVTREQVEQYPHPSTCPACGSQTHIEPGQEGMWDLVCRNTLCPAQIVSSYTHYLATLGVKGIGESQVERLLASGKLAKWGDWYRLEVKDFQDAGLSERQSLLAMAAIWMVEAPSKIKDNRALSEKIAQAKRKKLPIPGWQLFASLGIPTAGKQAGKVLLEHFGDFRQILQANKSQLSAVEDIGEKTAIIIEDYFEENRATVEDLLEFIDPLLPQSGKLSGQTFCLSGGFPNGKKYWEKEIERLGGKCTGSVSRKVDFLVAGDGSGEKTEAAKRLQSQGERIQIITVDELQRQLDA